MLSRNRLALAGVVFVAFGVGVAVAAFVRSPRTATRLDIVTSQKVTNVPVGCRQAITVTRHLKGLTDMARLPAMVAEFHAAVDDCRIPAACTEVFKQATKLFSEIQKTRPDALAIYRAFQAAASQCR